MSSKIKTLDKFISKAWKGTKAINKSVKKIIEKLHQVLKIELNILEKRIKDTPYDFLREELTSKKPEIVRSLENVKSFIERDNILIQIADLENQIINFRKQKEQGEFISDLIKTNIIKVEKLKIEEKTINSNRKNRVVFTFENRSFTQEFIDRNFPFQDNLYSKIRLCRIGEEWKLFNIYIQAASSLEENMGPSLHNFYYQAFGFHPFGPSPKIFILNDKNNLSPSGYTTHVSFSSNIRDIIKHAIRCGSAKVFKIPFGKDTAIIIGAKSKDRAIDEVVAYYLHVSYAGDSAWLKDDSIVGDPMDYDFWENNEDLIQNLIDRFSPNTTELK